MADDELPVSLQESILTTLVFDEKFGAQIAVQVKAEHFDGPYREIAARVLEYRQRYHKPPGRAHLDDMFGRIIQTGDRAPRLRRILFGLASQLEGLNAEYVAHQAQNFIRQQRLKTALHSAGERYQQGGEGLADDIEEILYSALRVRDETMDAGIFLNDTEKSLAFLEKSDRESLPLEIPELDRIGIGPVPQELLLYIAPKNSGKSWFCVHCGRQAIIRGKKVLHISLEMSGERQVIPRYLQSIFGGTTNSDSFERTELQFNQMKQLVGWKVERASPVETLEQWKRDSIFDFTSPEARRALLKKMKPWGTRLGRLVVKQFPTGSLTIPHLIGYLDYLELTRKFVPQVLLMDYPDLMAIPTNDYRLGVRRVYEQLRGIAVDRNMALVCPTQSNRSSLYARHVRSDMVAEDKSKVDTADVVLTYSQTRAERRRNLARLWLEYSRTGPRDITVLLSQSYATGQYVLQSAYMSSNYWDKIKAEGGGGEEKEEE